MINHNTIYAAGDANELQLQSTAVPVIFSRMMLFDQQ